MSYYSAAIQAVLARLKRTDIDPRHIEGWMRLEHGTLDHLSGSRFRHEVALCIDLVDDYGVDRSDELAASYGLMREAS